jgi:hypothetical protein
MSQQQRPQHAAVVVAEAPITKTTKAPPISVPAAEVAEPSAVQLGFCVPVTDAEHWEQLSHHSSSWNDWDGGHVGARPSWLTFPPPTALKCRSCREPMQFVCQIYAPLDSDKADNKSFSNAFHRSLYVFACCCATNSTRCKVRVLRGQLPRRNDFWPETTVQQQLLRLSPLPWQRVSTTTPTHPG